MTSYAFDLKPCSRLTVGTVGPPGQRTFYLQGMKDRNVISLVIEKEHARALAEGIDELLKEVQEQYPPDYIAEETKFNMDLLDPVSAEFRVGRLGLGYDADEDLLVVFVQEIGEEEESPESDAMVGRFWASREQMGALSRHAKKIAAAGRPICALCGEPIDPDGHFCPPSNGHQVTNILQ
ncbi:MAG: DUF3090 domain-containing protein [Chloroflexota bacterium]|nr:DUF3090 domain-containing protein [Chloroflexota bacterium]